MVSAPKPLPRVLVFWLLWFSIAIAVPIYQFTLGQGLPLGKNAPGAGFPPIVLIPVAEVLLASAVRWLVLPRFVRPSQQLILMIVGLALSEGAEFMGIFLVPSDQPQTRMLIFLLSLLGVIQFMPIFAREPTARETSR